MIVYSDRRRAEDPRALLIALRARLAAAGAVRTPSPDDLAALLIEAGAFEAAVSDALQPERDDAPCLAATLSAVTLDLAHAQRGGSGQAISPHLASAAKWLDIVAASPLPDAVHLSEPEGFAFYALHPDMHREAARRFVAAVRPTRVAVLGLRNIGTTLAAVVAAEVEAAGIPVETATVRPRGHPWEREVRLGPRLQRWLAGAAGGHVAIVDEGPGLSGTSFACVAEAASRAGAPDERIHIFPSWDADGCSLRSERARARWSRHRRWTTSFEDTILPRLAATWGGRSLRDLSGGLWRDLHYGEERPATQPQHERRKYLVDGPDGSPVLLKFIGLAARGERMLARARAQAEAGLGPEVLGLSDGFIAYRHHEGRPAGARDLGRHLVDAMARHTAFLAQEDKGPARFDDILAMTRLNLCEGLGEEPDLAWTEALRRTAASRPAAACDGRMLPQEWLLAGDRLLKCDGLDHHDDHFWPGPQDPAWDLAGAAVEWGMDAAAREALLEAYLARVHDRGLREVLPFYRVAYLAWRLGYASLAAETLGGSPDGLRMSALRDHYRALLPPALARAGR